MAHTVFRRLLCALASALAQPAVAAITGPAAPITAEPLSDPRIPGFRYPESEATLTRWITTLSRSDNPEAAAVAFEKIHLHGWGLWAAVTAETNQSAGGQRLRAFETWLTPDDLAGSNAAAGAPSLALRSRAPLRQLAQLRETPPESEPVEEESAIARVVGFVKFDPTAAAHIQKQELLNASALDILLEAGAQQIPPFPASALAVKPVFQVLAAKDLVAGRYYRLKAWPGPPATPQPWGPAQWPGCVWLDLVGGGSGRGAIDPIAAADGTSRTDETTYPIASLINYRLSAADALALNQEKPATGASAGDYAILVAMHLSSREIARWTWQTFWWTPTPEDPHAPSSAAIGALRPPQLRGAARNYAMSLGYMLLSPDQPYTGGENKGAAVYTYNPWIEARVAAADLPDSQPGLGPDGRAAANNLGIQTNCMSCHARANYNPQKRTTAPRFSGARYTDLIDPQFVGTLQVDLLWSVARHAR